MMRAAKCLALLFLLAVTLTPPAASATPSWSVKTTPNPSGNTYRSLLKGISCSEASACLAVGYTINETTFLYKALAESWNGTQWKLQTIPSPAESENSYLKSVACTASNACEAVGFYTHEKGIVQAFAEHWNGTEWKLQAIPSLKSSQLHSVSCTSSTSCTAVGSYLKEKFTATLVEVWNGTEWKQQTAPNAAEKENNTNILYGVACPSSTSCVAVGYYAAGGFRQPLAEKWNGTEWTKLAPKLVGESVRFRSVSCTASNACTGVGDYWEADQEFTLAEQWNGTEWKVQKTPNPGGKENRFWGVSCTSATACIATGGAEEEDWNETEHTLAESWNGVEWLAQETPNPTGIGGYTLAAVSCVSSTHCEAVGYYMKSLGLVVTLGENYS